MLVYRVETVNGGGPYYKSSYDVCNRLSSHNNCPNHPGAGEEGLIHWTDRPYFFCGFVSIEQLKAWFMGHRAFLRRKQYQMAIYKVHGRYVRKGKFQVTFRKDKAELIKRVKIP